MAEEKTHNEHINYKIALWYGYIISGIFLLYGGVQIVLSILDRNYGKMGEMILFAIIGLILLMTVLAFGEHKKFGWYGMIAMNSLIIILSLFGNWQYDQIILLLLSAISMFMLFSSNTKKYF